MSNIIADPKKMFLIVRNHFRLETDDFGKIFFSPLGGRFDEGLTNTPQAVEKFPVGNPYEKIFFSLKSFSMTRKWFLMMRNMFLGSEMMFDMIRNYFGVEKNDLIFRPLGRRFDESRQKVTPSPPGGGGS